ncbi:hypothetical protein EW146_g5832 [Bondarzewia mesenterica]|uniref:CxC2-like cysteine cluster KDZ transposase-associated domain-containing protein n=1 Tax=Bondarzewia mesenterica TaxID=1095465 RepID=A0A4S4LRA2_9AGAM|nr:hypothetical protein EW146_g5832 [Bondarzewia mesenterica]
MDNPIIVPWDAQQYADHARTGLHSGPNAAEKQLTQVYPPLHPQPFPHYDLPAIKGRHPKVVIWQAAAKLRPMHKLKEGGNWCSKAELYRNPEDCTGMPPGLMKMSSGWFEQAHHTAEYLLKCSASFRDRYSDLGCHQWLQNFVESSAILSGIMRIIHPEQYFTGMECIEKLGNITDLTELVHHWPSVFNGISAEWYDLLVTVSPYDWAIFELPRIGLSFKYNSGTVAAICGQVLTHSVPQVDDNLKCKTTALNFYSKLWRVIISAFPDTISHGCGHRADGHAGNGELTLFCLACPQPGVNIPDNWREDEEKWKYMRSFVMDGNFSAEHMKMKNLWDDVMLTDKTGYMVTEGNYKDHLQAAIESKDMNMDYSLSGALKTIGDLPQVLIMYDVMCQYGMHLLRYFADSPHLTMPTGLKIIKGIGAAQVDGEILETLMVLALCKKYIKVMDALEASQEGFQALDTSIDHQLKERMPSQAAYQLTLAKNEQRASRQVLRGSTAWLSTGIKIQEAQLANPGAEWENIPLDIISDPEVNKDEPILEELVEEYTDDIPDAIPTEKMAIALPSILQIIKCRKLGLEELANQELER